MDTASSGVTTAIVVAGGAMPPVAIGSMLPPHDLVVAADSGLHAAVALGLVPDLVVGDMDSVIPSVLEAAVRTGATVERAPRDKDAVDTELAVHAAVARGARRLIVVTGGGGRLDHALGVLSCLLHPMLTNCEVHVWWGDAYVRVLHGPTRADITGAVGSIVGLIAAGGDAIGIITQGLRWSLNDEDLPFHSTRGVSNVLTSPTATVSLRAGRVFVIQPSTAVH